jgi:hypothetical protein
MKLRFEYAMFYATLIFVAISCLNGCANTGMDRAIRTNNSMQTVETDMARGEIKTGCEKSCDLK